MAGYCSPGASSLASPIIVKLTKQNLEKERTLQKIEQSIPLHSYTASALDCPGLLHFIYKSRQLVQITMPEWPETYVRDEQGKRR